MEYGNYLLPIIYWSFLPSLGAKFAQNLLYKIVKPQAPNSPQWSKDRNKCYLFVVGLFLIYSVISAERDLGVNYYQNLGVSPLVDDKSLRAAFRAQSLIHHPDKNTNADEQVYVSITRAYEVLKDSVKRNAYDHFGPDALKCEKCLTFKEYLMDSFDSVGIFYGVSFLIGVIFDFVGTGSFSPYWKLVSFFGLVAFEMSLLVSLTDPLPYFLPWRTIHEKIQLARHLFIVFTIAMNQIGPFFFPVDSRTIRQLLMELEANVVREGEQSQMALVKAYTPFHVDGKGNGALKMKMEKLFAEKILEADPEFQQALGQFQKENQLQQSSK